MMLLLLLILLIMILIIKLYEVTMQWFLMLPDNISVKLLSFFKEKKMKWNKGILPETKGGKL